MQPHKKTVDNNACDFENTFGQECIRIKEHVKNSKMNVTLDHIVQDKRLAELTHVTAEAQNQSAGSLLLRAGKYFFLY